MPLTEYTNVHSLSALENPALAVQTYTLQ